MRAEEIISQREWDSFWEKYSPNALFQSYIWGEVLLSKGAKITRLGFYKGSKLVGIALIYNIEAKRGKYLHVRHGPVLIGNKNDWNWVLKKLEELGKAEGAWFIRISPLIDDSSLLSNRLVLSPVHEVDSERCWVLDLEKDEEGLLQDMRKTTRYEIRRAQKLGVDIRESSSDDDIDSFLALYRKTAKRQGFVPHVGIKEEFRTFSLKNKAVLYLGSYEGELLSAAIILFSGTEAIYHHSASKSTNIPVNYLLQWRAICDAKKRNMKSYNFWGIAPDDKPNHPWRGLTLFKKGFGGREVRYLHSRDLPIHSFYRISYAIDWIRRFVKGY